MKLLVHYFAALHFYPLSMPPSAGTSAVDKGDSSLVRGMAARKSGVGRGPFQFGCSVLGQDDMIPSAFSQLWRLSS